MGKIKQIRYMPITHMNYHILLDLKKKVHDHIYMTVVKRASDSLQGKVVGSAFGRGASHSDLKKHETIIITFWIGRLVPPPLARKER